MLSLQMRLPGGEFIGYVDTTIINHPTSTSDSDSTRAFDEDILQRLTIEPCLDPKPLNLNPIDNRRG